MARDDRPPTDRSPPTLGPRRLREQLSSSLGLEAGRRRGGERRIEPRLDPRLDEAAAAIAAEVAPVAVPPTNPPPHRDDRSETTWIEAAPEDERTATTVPSTEPPVRPSREQPPRPPVAGSSASVAAADSLPEGQVSSRQDPVATPTSAPTAAAVVPARAASPKPSAAKPPTVETGPAGGNTIVPPQAVAGRALVAVVAIMGFLACLAVGMLALVISAAHDWQLDVSREVTIQVKPGDGPVLAARLAKALDLARATAGVRSARLVDEREGAALLEPWLGSGLDLSSLPIPRLVVLDLGDPSAADLVGLRHRLDTEVGGAVLDDHAVWAARLRTMASAVVVVGIAVVVLVFVAMALSVVFATRSAMAGNRDVIEVLHFVGAEDRFIAGQFQRHFLQLGLIGGSIGGAAAIIGFVLLDLVTRTSRGDPLADQAHALFGGFSVGVWGHLGVVVVVALVAVATAVTSRATVLGHLRRLD